MIKDLKPTKLKEQNTKEYLLYKLITNLNIALNLNQAIYKEKLIGIKQFLINLMINNLYNI